MKILVFLAVWKRPEITEICFMGLNRLRKVPGYDINVLAVISEEEMIPLCEKYDVKWVMHENLPLGIKKNFGVKEALKFDWEYLVEIGSDDLLKDEFLKVYAWDSPILGLNDVALINTETGACKRLSSKASRYGLGRAVRRSVIEKCGDLWHPAKNKGLDNSATIRMALNGFGEKRVSCVEPVAIGLKSSVNIWKYQGSKGKKYPFEKAIKGLSEPEINAIESLCYSTNLV